ncbi:MAG: hypothetical protein LBR68_02765 [Lachnoclostridium sp.]|nr:hypothetical protein [Lachnoclostridium sp.]
MIENGEAVCQKEEINPYPKGVTIGTNVQIKKKGDKITYNFRNISPNGELYFFEEFEWSLGEGLTGYRSG